MQEGPRRGPRRRWIRQAVSVVVGFGTIAGLVLWLNPVQIGRAAARFPLVLIPIIVALNLGIYTCQGLRWHFLLGEAGARLRLRDSVLLNAAGQTITALVPLGDLTRALFAAEVSGRAFGTIAATVTVQELTYTMLLILFALPVVLELGVGVGLVFVTLIGMAGIVVILTVSPVFRAVHRIIARIPLLSRLLPAIDELQHETADLLHRPDTIGWSVLDLARAVLAITVLWVMVQGLSPGTVSWWKTAFIFAVSAIGGAVSLIPGGVGVNEAGVAGVLILFGVDGGSAGVVALLQRGFTTGIALVLGFSSYAVVRRRFKLGGIFQLTAHEPSTSAIP